MTQHVMLGTFLKLTLDSVMLGCKNIIINITVVEFRETITNLRNSRCRRTVPFLLKHGMIFDYCVNSFKKCIGIYIRTTA
jgi:hypothetical protein